MTEQRREYMKAYYEANKEKLKDKRKANKDRKAEFMQSLIDTNKQMIKAQIKAYEKGLIINNK